ncbi:MAG: hypothetical protein ACQETV_01390 [Actinomycetota bacterium]
MEKRTILEGMAAQRDQTVGRLGDASVPWERVMPNGLSVLDVVTWLVETDAVAGRGRLRALASVAQPASTDDPDLDPAPLLEALDAGGRRLRERLRRLPRALWAVATATGAQARLPLDEVLALYVQREWAALAHPLGDLDEAPSGVVLPADPASLVITDAALARLPVEVLPRATPRVGVVRLEVAPLPGSAPVRWWGVDFARKHYGPRVTALPDARVGLWGGALVRILDGAVGWRELEGHGLDVEGDRDLAAACLEPTGTAA